MTTLYQNSAPLVTIHHIATCLAPSSTCFYNQFSSRVSQRRRMLTNPPQLTPLFFALSPDPIHFVTPSRFSFPRLFFFFSFFGIDCKRSSSNIFFASPLGLLSSPSLLSSLSLSWRVCKSPHQELLAPDYHKAPFSIRLVELGKWASLLC